MFSGDAQMKDKQAATALAALEKLRLEEQMELLEVQRAEEIGSLKVALEKLRSITYQNNIDWRETLCNKRKKILTTET